LRESPGGYAINRRPEPRAREQREGSRA
jgi:hypothetical protein